MTSAFAGKYGGSFRPIKLSLSANSSLLWSVILDPSMLSASKRSNSALSLASVAVAIAAFFLAISAFLDERWDVLLVDPVSIENTLPGSTRGGC